MYKHLLFMFALSFPLLVFANSHPDNTHSAEFFASNNTNEIDLKTAFNRLKGSEQEKLKDDTIDLLQQDKVEQGKFENILGTYKMSNDQHITADNSEIFITSTRQILSSEKIFSIAKELANNLRQESVAVFIPSNTEQPIIGDTILKLKSHSFTITEIIKLIHEKLPAKYEQGFSLHLNKSCADFDNTTVKEVEWLGRNIKPEEIKKAFPGERMESYYGKAYLVFKNGQREQL